MAEAIRTAKGNALTIATDVTDRKAASDVIADTIINTLRQPQNAWSHGIDIGLAVVSF